MSTMIHELLNSCAEILSMMRNELIIFVIAVVVHGVLFSSHRIGTKKKNCGKVGLEKKNCAATETPVKARETTAERSEIIAHIPKTESDKYTAFRQQEREAQIGHINSLKALQRGAFRSEVDRILVAAMNQSELDEALLTAIVDATIRVDRTDLLPAWIRRQQSNFQRVKRPHTFSSIIRAYGTVHNVSGVWNAWSDMRKSHVTPTCVTLGCMVEALVANGDPDSAYDLIHEIRAEETTGKSIVNAVIYGTVLKGFAHQKKFNRVWSVYQEMLAIETDFTIVTFNTIIDACARCEELHRIPTLLKDMDRLMIQPNIITYGAILKGYCQEGNLDKAYELLKSMRETTDFKPDEIMYNSLLDGCARQGLWERANAVLREMEEAGVRPSNFTLSVLVKVGRRSTSKLENIFSVCHEVSQKYGFCFNVHVYTNLVHACVDRKDWPRALSVFVDMLRERIRPDARTYTVLLKGLYQAGERKSADGMLRAALGLSGAHPDLMAAVDHNASRLRLDTPLPKGVVSEIVDGIVSSCSPPEEDLGARLLQDVKSLGFSIDARVKLRFAARVAKS